ncbi:MAG: tannase/feruloyl esterase family alpha/beta hydrolase, partial [Steroidobacteraceae bacterium]
MGGEEHGLKGCRSAFLAVALLCLASPAQAEIARARRATDCEALARLRLPDVTIGLADAIGPGTFTSPDGETHAVPAFCRIHGEARPTRDSLINFELWLPAGGWNGRYYQLGNGGFAGRIHYPSLASEVRRLHVVAATDTGHRAGPFDAAWALGHPEKIVDFGYRSLKVTSDAASALIRAYYSAPARHRYFVGCSNGGRQALMVAQRFPEDWDGVLAGAPAHDWTRQLAAIAWIQKALRSDAESWILAAKLPAIQRAALESCTPAARVVNGVPTDPRSCDFDPAVL